MEFFDNYNEKIEQFRTNPIFKEYVDYIKKVYEEEVKNPVYTPNFDDYMKFFREGDRSDYESIYFLRRRRLNTAVLLYLYSGEQKYLDEICNMIWIVCSEPTWCLPAHIKFHDIHDEGGYRPLIDLFAAETGRDLAEIHYILKDSLPEEIKCLIESEVEGRIFHGFETREYWWETTTNNWLTVCGGSVGMTYMYLKPQGFDAVKPRILSTMKLFIDNYGDDGCCTEGLGYWGYGFGYYIFFADALYRFTDGKEDIRHSPKVDNIALFRQKVSMRENINVSFSDSRRTLTNSIVGFLCYLAKNYKGFAMPEICWSNLGSLYSITGLLRNILWAEPELMKKSQELPFGTEYLANAEWYLSRREKYSFAAKCGYNAEPHNHNDVGSFIFATDKGQMLADIGALEYTRDTFSPRRYTLLHNSSLGHSVPIVDGKEQEKGEKYRGKVLSAGENDFSMEIDGAYNGDVGKITRSFSLNDDGVVLTDRFDGLNGKPVTERFISVIKPQVLDDCVVIGDTIIKAHTLPEISLRVLEDKKPTTVDVYIMDYPLSGEEFKLEITKKSK